jgi:hypothetical protein
LVVTLLLLLAQGPPGGVLDSTPFDSAVREGILERVYPGAALVVGRRRNLFSKPTAVHVVGRQRTPQPRQHLLGRASLTKGRHHTRADGAGPAAASPPIHRLLPRSRVQQPRHRSRTVRHR